MDYTDGGLTLRESDLRGKCKRNKKEKKKKEKEKGKNEGMVQHSHILTITVILTFQ